MSGNALQGREKKDNAAVQRKRRGQGSKEHRQVRRAPPKLCKHLGCTNGAISRGLCSKHGGGKRCQHKDCTNGAVSPAEFCTQHGGGKRCETLAHLPNDVPPPAYYAVGGAHMCWGCCVALCPDKAHLKVRREHYVLAELERLVPELGAYQTIWDCAVPGGCSLKQPDKLYKLCDRYLHVEVDEFGHADKACVDEDTRLELIAADVGLPGLVLRLDPDNPPCFRHRQLPNGERAYERIQSPFNSLLAQAAEKVRSFLADLPPTNVERVFLRSTPGVLATRPNILAEAGDRKRLRQRRRTHK